MPLIQIFAPVSATTVTSILSPSHHHSICCQYFQNMTTLPLAHGEHRSFPLSSSSSLLAYALRTVRCWPTSLLCMLRTTWPRSPPSRRSYSQRSRRWHARGGGGGKASGRRRVDNILTSWFATCQPIGAGASVAT
jgi:hypothetical protein